MSLSAEKLAPPTEQTPAASGRTWRRLYRTLAELEADSLHVRRYQNGDVAKPDEIFVGVGRWMDTVDGVERPAAHEGLVLQNKGTRKRFGRSFSSAAKFAFSRPGQALSAWRPGALFDSRPEHGLSPSDVLSKMTLVVDDASCDSIFALIFALGWLAQCPEEESPREWLAAAEDWERGVSNSDPYKSWPALVAALVHSQFPVSTGTFLGDKEFAAAWLEALRFAGKCLIRDDFGPYSVPSLSNIPQWVRAEAALRQEQQVYFGWLEHAALVQLSVPLAGARDDRRRLCDAMLFVEDQPTGAAKCFYRIDRDRSPLSQGFQVTANYRPHHKGTGNDFTISADPLAGLDFTVLWEELERRENEKWSEGERPSNSPRALDYAPYEGRNRWNEPWFINPDHNLAAAPKRIGRNGPVGTRLTWEDVKDAVWTAFSPVAAIRLKGDDEALVALEDIRPIPSVDGPKCLFYAEWPETKNDEEGRTARSLPHAPTIARVFAAVVQRGRKAGPIRLKDLPAEEAFNRITLSGGFAVVSQHGAFILDDWRTQVLPRLDLKAAYAAAAELDQILEELDHDATGLVRRMRNVLDVRRQKRSEIAQLVRDSTELRAKLAEKRGALAKPPADPDARRLRIALDKEWALSERFEALEATTREIETSLRALLELRTSEAARMLSVWGFPLGAAGLLAEPISKAIQQYRGGAADDAPAWITLALFVGLAAVIVGVVWFLSSIGRPEKDRK